MDSLGPPPPPIPRRHTSRIPKSRREVFKSFDNLVSLANDQERWKLADVTRMGRNLVYRDIGEPPVLLEGLRECAEHAGAGAVRAGALGFAARSGVNVFILMFNVARMPKRFRAPMVLHAVFSVDSLHFGGMIGTFVALYKFIVNALPILTRRMHRERITDEFDLEGHVLPPHEDLPRTEIEMESPLDSTANSDVEHGLSLDSLAARRKSALKQLEFTPIPVAQETSTSTEESIQSSRAPSPSPQVGRRARFAEELILPPRKISPETERHALRHPGHLSTTTQAAVSLMREKGYIYERWHAALAGGIAGAMAIVMEKKGRRLGISQQMFVRGLQASFNHWSEWSGVKVPFGSVWVFALCCGQIMYGYLLRPDTIPPSYNSWIQKASIVPEPAIKINRQLVYNRTLNIAAQQQIADGLAKPWNGTASTVTSASRIALLDQIKTVVQGAMDPMASCAAIHPHHDSCVSTGVWRIYEAGIWMMPVYGALHFIPMLLFKRQALQSAPFRTLLRAALGTMRSASFLGVYVAIYQSYICLLHALYALPLSAGLKKILVSKPAWWLGGILSGLSLLVEERKRREELAMYVLPKGLESGWKLFRGEVFGVPTRRKRGWKSDVALCAAGMSMVMSAYQHSPQHLSGLVRRLLYQFVGPN